MSNMSAKKKSRFQITSVIQAQVAGNSITDDTESNDDLDESRAEDVSSDPVEVPHTGLSVGDRSSSEEDFDHTEEDHHGPVSVNGLLSALSTGGRSTPLISGGSVPVVAASQPIVQTPTTQASSVSSGPPTSYSSRFRVIKLDHGTGEPFKRGRWACTEFYEKEFDSTRTMDSVKPTVTHDHNVERDSGVVCNSVAAPRAFPAQSIEKIDNGSPKGQPVSLPPDPMQHLHGSVPLIGSVASAFQPTRYATAKTQQAHDKTPAISQNFIHNSLNGVHQGAMLKKSPAMPSAMQPQQLVYSNGVSPGQPEDHSQHFSASSQSFPATTQPNVPRQPVSTIAGSEEKGLQVQSSEAPGLHPARVNSRAMSPVSQTIIKMGIRASSPITITSNSVQSVPESMLTLSAASSRFSAAGDQIQDARLKSDALPLPIADVVKPLITEGLSLPTPAVTLFGIPIPVDGDDDSASGASVVAIDNKIEQAMDLVKNHLMYAVREEVEVLKEQIKELYERNSVLERENAVLKSLANTEQLTKLSSQLKQTNSVALPQLQQQQSMSTNGSNAPGHYEVVKSSPHQPNITTA